MFGLLGFRPRYYKPLLALVKRVSEQLPEERRQDESMVRNAPVVTYGILAAQYEDGEFVLDVEGRRLADEVARLLRQAPMTPPPH